MIRKDVRKNVGRYLTQLMSLELTEFLGREPHKRTDGDTNHGNGSYARGFTLKGIGKVNVEVPRDRNADFMTQVIPALRNGETDFSFPWPEF